MEGGDFPRPMGATTGTIPTSTTAPQQTLPGIEPIVPRSSKRASVLRAKAGEKLRGDVRLRVFDVKAKPGRVRVILTGARSGITVEEECYGGTIFVAFTIIRLWLKGAERLHR